MSKTKVTPALATILQLLDFHIRQMIDLQLQEDAVPNPPDFEQLADAHAVTEIIKDFEKPRKPENRAAEEFDVLAEADHASDKALWRIFELLGIKRPAELVREYPFKTESGKSLKALADSINSCCTELHNFPYIRKREKEIASQAVNDCLILVERSFPDLTGASESSHALKCQHYYADLAFLALRRCPRLITRSENKKLINGLSQWAWLWLKYQGRRLIDRFSHR